MPRQPTQPTALPFAAFLREWWFMPFTFWKDTFESFYHPQLFLGCNIQDMDDEYHVLNEVGSYGKQISQIQKVLDVFIAHPPANLTAEEKIALEEFRAYTVRVAAALAESRGPRSTELTQGYVDRLEQALQAKRVLDKGEFDRILARLKLLVDREMRVNTFEMVDVTVN
jgi:hypothetical protein